jgi:DNA polymerase-4
LKYAIGKVKGAHIKRLSFGIDERNVEPAQVAKSISSEETFVTDLFELVKVHSEIRRLSDSVGKRLRASEKLAKTLSLKVRLSDFSTLVRSVTLPNPTDSGKVLAREAFRLLETVDISTGVRLLGVGASNFSQVKDGLQLSFDDLDSNDSEWRETEDAIDAIRAKYGPDSIGLVSTLTQSGLNSKKRGIQQWGPNSS